MVLNDDDNDDGDDDERYQNQNRERMTFEVVCLSHRNSHQNLGKSNLSSRVIRALLVLLYDQEPRSKQPFIYRQGKLDCGPVLRVLC
jgi:hypothetical protein